MRKYVLTGKLALGLLLVSLLSISATSSFLVNSNEWTEVYAGSYESYNQGETPYFARSDNLGVFNILPYGEPVTVVESAEDPVVANIGTQAESKGYEVEEVITVQGGNLGIGEDDPESVVVVPESYPSASLTAAPYAQVTNSTVLIVNSENLEEVESIMQEASSTLLVGEFTRAQSDALVDDADETVLSPSKFNLSVKMAEKFLEEKNSERVIISSGDHITRGIMEGKNPVLLSGTNFLPDVTRKFLVEDPQHGLNTAIMTGNEMTTVGEEIRDYNITRDGETTDERLNVFVKYGVARGDSSTIYAISKFPLPTGDVSLSISSARFDPESGQLFITYRNDGQSRMYQLTTFEVIADGGVVAQGGDEEAVFIGSETERTVSYNVEMGAEEAENAEVEFSTTYGSSPNQMDTYLTEQGEFSPPLRKNLTLQDIEDESNVTVSSLEYVENLGRFRIILENHGGEAFSQVRLRNIEVKGQEESFASEVERIPPGSKKQVYIPAELDSVDQERNERISYVLSHGEEAENLVEIKQGSANMEVVRSNRLIFIGAGAVILLLVLAAGIKRYVGVSIQLETD